jgi:glycosyltransferase involved in cell wall biosynthesis
MEGRRFAMVVGDPSPRKNLAVVLAAWKRVVARDPTALLILIGPPAWGAPAYGPDLTPLLDTGNVMRLVGVDDGALRWCYENAAVVLAPSLAEGYGLPAIEALEFGAPLVTSVDPALVEVSGDLAEHLPFGDVEAWTEAALRHLHRARQPALRGTRPVRTWDDVADETVNAVRGVAN